MQFVLLPSIPLPGKAIVVLDSKTKLVTDIFPCVDGHAQERSLFDEVLSQVKSQELWCATTAYNWRKSQAFSQINKRFKKKARTFNC